MPDDPGLVVSSHTPQGTVFCCAAEAILCGLEDNRLSLFKVKILIMEPLFEYGICQEDSRVDASALDLQEGDRLLCISSAGETPLNLLANFNIRIAAVDTLEPQNCLTRLKLAAARSLEPQEAAALLGYTVASPEIRGTFFKRTSEFLVDQDLKFWESQLFAIEKGPVNLARFERYISGYNWLAIMLLGKKHLLKLCEQDSIAAQEEYFDRYLSTALLKGVFKIVFHPKVYRKRGISDKGLIHSSESDMAGFFYARFRDFCCSTLARNNYYYQFTFFNQILFPEAYPDFLKEPGIQRIRKNWRNLEISQTSFRDKLSGSNVNHFNKLHLSNIGDWMSKEEFALLLHLVLQKSTPGARILFRYIHYNHPIPEDLAGKLEPDYELGEKLIKSDRYPFYGIVPIRVNSR